MKKLVLLLALLCSVAASADEVVAGAATGYVFSKYGKPVLDAKVSICTNLTPRAACTLASLYTSVTDTTPVGNPVSVNGVGQFTVYAPVGVYRAVINSAQFSTPQEQTVAVSAGLAIVPNLDAGKITTGTFSSALIPTLDASMVVSGVLDVARIPASSLSLNASQILAGTLNSARINWAAPGDIGSTTPAEGAFTTLNVTTAVPPGAGMQHVRTSTCTTASAINARCVTTVTWPVTFTDTNYTAVCGIEAATAGHIARIFDKTTAHIQVEITDEVVTDGFTGTLHCIAMHD